MPASGRHYRHASIIDDAAIRHASIADDAAVHHARYLLAEHRHILIEPPFG